MDISYTLEPLDSICILKTQSPEEILDDFSTSKDCFILLDCTGVAKATRDEFRSQNTFFLEPLKDVALPNPKFSFSEFTVNSSDEFSKTSKFKDIFQVLEKTDAIISFSIESDAVATFVFLEVDFPGYFSDNGFVLLPNQPRKVYFKLKQGSGKAGLSWACLESFKDSLSCTCMKS
jgi:hypothetical protein